MFKSHVLGNDSNAINRAQSCYWDIPINELCRVKRNNTLPDLGIEPGSQCSTAAIVTTKQTSQSNTTAYEKIIPSAFAKTVIVNPINTWAVENSYHHMDWS